MDIGTIIVIVIAALVGLAVLWMLIWGLVALVALRTARRAAASFDRSPFGIDPDLRSSSIREQHERIKRWGIDS